MISLKEIIGHTFADQLLLEGKVEDMKEKYYKDIPEEDWHKILRADPTTKINDGGEYVKMGDFVKWLIGVYAKNKQRVLEDLPKLHNAQGTGYLDVYAAKKQRLPVDDRNIFKFKTPVDVYEMLKTQLGEDAFRTEHELKVDIEREQTERLEFKNWYLYIPKTGKAAAHYASMWKTHWCTKDEHTADGYLKEGPLYIFEDKKHPATIVYQLHIPTGQLADFDDRMHSYDEVFKQGDDNDVANYIVDLELKEKRFKATKTCYIEGRTMILKELVYQPAKKQQNKDGKYVTIGRSYGLYDYYAKPHRYGTDMEWACKIVSGDGFVDENDSVNNFKDILNHSSFNTQNRADILGYIKTKYPEKYDEVEAMGDDDIVEALSDEGDDAVSTAVEHAYARAYETAMNDEYHSIIVKQLESDFEGKIDWDHKDGAMMVVKINRDKDVWKFLSVIGGEDSDPMKNYIKGLSEYDNDEEKFSNHLDLDRVYAHVTDELFNEALNDTLQDNGIEPVKIAPPAKKGKKK